MIKTWRRPLMAGFATVALGLMAAMGAARAQGPIQLKLLDRLPPDHYIARYATNVWIDEVQRATDGAVAIQRYPSERLGKSKDMLSLIKTGVTDMGEIFPGYLGEQMVLSTVAELPGMVPDACAASRAFLELAKDGAFIDSNELVPNGIRMLYVVGLPQYELFTSKKIDTIQSLTGLKIRSSGATMDAGLRSVGSVPIRMGAPELTESFARGTVDGTAYPVASIFSYDLQKLVRYATVNGTFGSSMTFYGISRRVWDKLPAKVQQAMIEAGARTTERACGLIDRDNEEAMSRLEKEGAVLVRFSAADIAKLKAFYGPVADAWAAALDKKGKPGTQTLTRFREAIERHRASR
ncbi:C4-dicarboxylate ABC transporter [Vineibacter terrae]|uniref:C4-dicarboxylate ABC transporter n=1 Tax=Vineibacter terrae TaxID=2586908 RepID=A0A5C8PM15_9HYPH|nr:TRAP transporter substrate-binding protein DctP [Vineibacter terrae]TXL75344.1 C4-dicarboxylate ABC transporter [Vineibacter terrae]